LIGRGPFIARYIIASYWDKEVEGGLLLDVVVLENAAVLELVAGECEALVVRRDALLVLDLLFDGLYGVGRLDFEGDGLAHEHLHEDLHAIDLRWEEGDEEDDEREARRGAHRVSD
jgi:hypothetical protein